MAGFVLNAIVVLIHLIPAVKVKLLIHVRLFATPWTVAYQAPPTMGFSRQEYWSGVPLPSQAAGKYQIFNSNNSCLYKVRNMDFGVRLVG